MTTMSSDPCSRPGPHASIKDMLTDLAYTLDAASNRGLSPIEFDEIGELLLLLHARVRVEHAVGAFHDSALDGSTMAPELSKDVERLQAEHTTLLGLLDHAIRPLNAIADQSSEDKEVFVMRLREIIAVLRRHEAEEDRIFYLSVWRDTGGEC